MFGMPFGNLWLSKALNCHEHDSNARPQGVVPLGRPGGSVPRGLQQVARPRGVVGAGHGRGGCASAS